MSSRGNGQSQVGYTASSDSTQPPKPSKRSSPHDYVTIIGDSDDQPSNAGEMDSVEQRQKTGRNANVPPVDADVSQPLSTLGDTTLVDNDLYQQ